MPKRRKDSKDGQRRKSSRLLRVLRWIPLGVLTFLALLIVHAHIAIRWSAPELPPHRDLEVSADADLPVAAFYINTARQPSPRFTVLDADLDPTPDEPYVMGHAAYGLRWDDGRIAMIDTGLRRDQAEAFGAKIEILGAEPSVSQGSVAEQLGDAKHDVSAVMFTHLHEDHTDGLAELCEGRDGALTVWQGPRQHDESNHTTRPGREHVETAPCAAAKVVTMTEGDLTPIPDLPGLRLFEAGGHTPGSQVFVATVRGKAGDPPSTWVFAGDLANHFDGVVHDVPKPAWYSWFLVPESEDQLRRARAWLREAHAIPGAYVLLAHDLAHLEGSGLPSWSALPSSHSDDRAR